ncbi:hypothetical protein K402DRAFT_272573 [Aulographum hederae CBS 113979]|uniref:Uncharacterized protein n=1 Tax=Aulographum hederae CBS 113979 TaxID=1176131 RepID=A0A6G1H8F4_9PEZI|nr:hypothetical protein K402DRAFT_272573 [Aulographum hederae CBS 113979]
MKEDSDQMNRSKTSNPKRRRSKNNALARTRCATRSTTHDRHETMKPRVCPASVRNTQLTKQERGLTGQFRPGTGGECSRGEWEVEEGGPGTLRNNRGLPSIIATGHTRNSEGRWAYKSDSAGYLGSRKGRRESGQPSSTRATNK